MFENMLTIGISVFLPTYGGGVSAQDEEAGRNREWSFGW